MSVIQITIWNESERSTDEISLNLCSLTMTDTKSTVACITVICILRSSRDAFKKNFTSPRDTAKSVNLYDDQTRRQLSVSSDVITEIVGDTLLSLYNSKMNVRSSDISWIRELELRP